MCGKNKYYMYNIILLRYIILYTKIQHLYIAFCVANPQYAQHPDVTTDYTSNGSYQLNTAKADPAMNKSR